MYHGETIVAREILHHSRFVLSRFDGVPVASKQLLTSIANKICHEFIRREALCVVHHARATTDVTQDENCDRTKGRSRPRSRIHAPYEISQRQKYQ